MTELGLDAEGLTETVFELGIFLFACLFGLFVCFCFFPFDETMTELLHRH
jgi:hypothetical protein